MMPATLTTPPPPLRRHMAPQADPPRASDLDLLAAYLRTRDVPCPACRHNLRGSNGAICPECGTALSLNIESPRVRLGGWLVSIVALAMPFGFALTLAAVAAYGATVQLQWMEDDWFIFGVLVFATVSWGAALGWVILRQSHWLAQPRRVVWARACFVSLGSITGLVVLVFGLIRLMAY